MKAELVKRQDRWDLYGEDGSKIASSAPNPMGKLSKENCEAIERGYDIEGLVDEKFKPSHKSIYGFDNWDWFIFKSGFKEGFLKAIELLGDKKFSEEDMRKAIAFGWDYEGRPKEEMLEIHNVNLEYNNSYFEDTQKYIQSLQQTECDVEVVMECCGNYSAPCKYNCEYGQKPKLDAEGNLILKKL
jgi:hypothetical protein